MERFLLFWLETGLVQGVLITMYLLFFKKVTFFHFNRLYLLATACLPPLIELADFRTSLQVVEFTLPAFTTSAGSSQPTSQNSDFEWLAAAYISVAAILLLVAAYRVLLIIRSGSNPVYLNSKIRLFNIPSGNGSYSFLNRIYIDQSLEQSVKQQILRHELTHVKQGHSFDLLLLSSLEAIFWINPIFRLIKKEIALVHEYLADAACKEESEAPAYIETLVSCALQTSSSNFSHSFSSSSNLKKRIDMIKKQSTPAIRKATYLAPFAALILFGFLFSCRNEKEKMHNSMEEMIQEAAQNDVHLDISKLEKAPKFPGGDEALFAYLGENISYPEQEKAEGTEGTVYVQFTINEKGNTEHVKLLKGVSDGLDSESIRVIQTMPAWEPGILDGKPVKTQFNLPIKFQLASTTGTDK